MYRRTTGKAYWASAVKKSIRRMVEKVHALTARFDNVARDHAAGERVEPPLRGWANYFQVGTDQSRVPSARQLHRYAVTSVVAHQAQSQTSRGGSYPLPHLYGYFGLVRLTPLGATVVGEGVMFCPRAGCGRSACPVR